MEAVISYISSVGFPIVCAIALGYYVYIKDKTTNEELEKLRNTLEANTLIITQLYDFLRNRNKDNDEE